MHRTIFKALALVFLLALISSAKTRHSTYDHKGNLLLKDVSSMNASELENRLRPYLEEKLNGRTRPHVKTRSLELPRENDQFALMRVWDELTPEFRQLYKRATAIPSDFYSYLSPGGHFELFYVTAGTDSVDITDTVGFGDDGNWRSKQQTPNGVPDYIDEAAFALDSARTMLVERFGFNAPLADPGPNGSSDRYKVAFRRNPDPSFYGETHLYGKLDGSSRGFQSHIEISNDWSDPSWEKFGYDKRPYDALRVTCAHELFHAVQYAMVWHVSQNVFLDSYPLGWTEGSAVLMEELAFDYINDYIQYANDFFYNPRINLLDNSYYSQTYYISSILIKYLFEKADDTSDISFVKQIFSNNYNQKISFDSNLQKVSQSLGKPWISLLNGFHTESYFSGSRSRDNFFISDAELMNSWTIPMQSPNTSKKSVQPYSMEIFYYKPQSDQSDTLKLFFSGQTDTITAGGSPWGASVILRGNSGEKIISVALDNNAQGSLAIPQWKEQNDCLVIVTNGSSVLRRSMTIDVESGPSTIPSGDSLTLTANSASSSAKFSIRALDDLSGTAQFQITNADTLLPVNQSPKPATAFFELQYPLTWSSRADLRLSISSSKQFLASRDVQTDSAFIYFWNTTFQKWEKVSSVQTSEKDSIFWTVKPIQSGIYTVLYETKASVQEFKIAPNVISLASGKKVRLWGAEVYEIKIFSMDGHLVCNAPFSDRSSKSVYKNDFGEVEWNLRNGNGKQILPGMYLMVASVVQQGEKKRFRNKIMIVP